MEALARWWFQPLPVARVAWLRTFFYAFVFVDVLLTTSWVARHGAVSTELYDPLFVGRVLSLPEPTPIVVMLTGVTLLVAAGIAATGRLPRLAGSVVAVSYLLWMVIAFSYGKVDHDRFAFLVALCVLPSVGRANWRDPEASEAAGWAIRSIQVAVVLAYFLAAFCKVSLRRSELGNRRNARACLGAQGKLDLAATIRQARAPARHSVRNHRLRVVVAAAACSRPGGHHVLDSGSHLSHHDVLDHFDHLFAARRLPAGILASGATRSYARSGLSAGVCREIGCRAR